MSGGCCGSVPCLLLPWPGLGEEGTASGLIMDMIADDKSQPLFVRAGPRGERPRPQTLGGFPFVGVTLSGGGVTREYECNLWWNGGEGVHRVACPPGGRGGMGDGGTWCSCEGGLWGH